MRTTPTITRRGFVTGSLAAATLGVHQRADASEPKPSRARNVILFCADGISPSAIGMADLVSRHSTGESLVWTRLLQETPNVAWLRTEPADLLVTDSAAAASSWSIGSRVNNGAVSVLPDGSTPDPLLHRLSKDGFFTGVLTTTSIHDASAAAMLVNARSRYDSRAVIRQLAWSRVSLAMGGGLGAWREHAPRHSRRETLLTEWEDRDRIDPTGHSQFMLLSEGDVPNALDRRDSEPSFVQMVAQMVECAVESAMSHALFLENEHTDTLSHANDAAGLVREVFEVDNAIRYLVDHVASRDDTLLIITTDHGTSGPNFTLRSDEAPQHVERLLNARLSLITMMRRFNRLSERTGQALGEHIQSAQGVTISQRETEQLDAWLHDAPVDLFRLRNRLYCPIASVLGNYFGTAFVSHDHTSELIPAIAIGPGAEGIRGAQHHVDVHGVITRAIGKSPTT
ncbi:MAG: alkaline phosphatase [Phycisphaerales bacterium JB043]